MEEKEPSNGSMGGGASNDDVKIESKETNGSDESNSGDVIRESIESSVSPSLNRLIVGNAKDGGSNKTEISSKAQRRARDKARRKAKKAKAIQSRKTSTDADPDDDDDDESTIISSSSNRSREEDKEQIRKLEAMVAALTSKAKLNRRGSVADVADELNGRTIYAQTEVKEDEKLKLATGYTLLDLFMRMEDAKVIGQHRQTISYLSLEVKNNLLLFLSQGNAKEAGWHSHEFSEIRDLNCLSDSDIQNLLVLMVRPNEKGMLVRILNNVKIPLSPTTADKPLYLA